jgi:putative oxidoreductase
MNSKIFYSKYEPQLYAIFRIVTGFLFMWHGSQKLFDFPHGTHEIPTYIMFTAAPVEFFGGLLVMIGLWTPWAAFLASGVMAYAYWSAHGLHAVLPLLNGGEPAMMYCFAFLFISARGSGVWSVDYWLKRPK